jgi:hypothetical protein
MDVLIQGPSIDGLREAARLEQQVNLAAAGALVHTAPGSWPSMVCACSCAASAGLGRGMFCGWRL